MAVPSITSSIISSSASCKQISEPTVPIPVPFPVYRHEIHLLSGTYYLDVNYNTEDRPKKASLTTSKIEDTRRQSSDQVQRSTSITNSMSISNPRLSITSLITYERNPTVHNWNIYNAYKKQNKNWNVNPSLSIEAKHQGGGLELELEEKEFNAADEGMSCLAGAFTLFAIVSNLGDILSSLATTTLLFRDGHFLWFSLSLCFTILPALVINVFSLIWYWEDALYRNSTKCAWRLRILAHCSFLGIVCRNVDILINGCRANCENKKQHPSVLGPRYYILYVEQRKVTAYLNLIRSFLQNAPQFCLQVYIWTVQNRTSTRLLLGDFHLIQYVSIVISLVTLSYSIVSYHQALHFSQASVLPMDVTACIGQFMWRLGTTGSRMFAIILALTAYPYVVMNVILIHWIMMIYVIKRQGTDTILIKKFEHKWFKSLYNVLMGSIHIFCFLNVIMNENRTRLLFFYIIQFVEDSFFIALWYLQLFTGDSNYYQPWIYHTGAFIYFNTFLLGIAALILFYQNFHPQMTSQTHSNEDDENQNDTTIAETESQNNRRYSKRYSAHTVNENSINVFLSKSKDVNATTHFPTCKTYDPNFNDGNNYYSNNTLVVSPDGINGISPDPEL